MVAGLAPRLACRSCSSGSLRVRRSVVRPRCGGRSVAIFEQQPQRDVRARELVQLLTGSLLLARAFANSGITAERLGDVSAQEIVVPWLGQEAIDRALVDRVGHAVEIREAAQ